MFLWFWVPGLGCGVGVSFGVVLVAAWVVAFRACTLGFRILF